VNGGIRAIKGSLANRILRPTSKWSDVDHLKLFGVMSEYKLNESPIPRSSRPATKVLQQALRAIDGHGTKLNEVEQMSLLARNGAPQLTTIFQNLIIGSLRQGLFFFRCFWI
jgi:hypothetical protein